MFLWITSATRRRWQVIFLFPIHNDRGKRDSRNADGVRAVARVLLTKRNMFSNIYGKIIYITGMAIFHLKSRIYLNGETAEIYKSLTVTWLNSAV